MSNDKELFETLHQDYHGMVFQLCLGYMKGDHSSANDLSQEVFINIWTALKNFRNASAYKTWIYRITVNTCLKYIRDTKSSYKELLDDEKISGTEEADFLRDHREKLLYDAIGQLKEVDRLIMMLVLEELNYEEISNVIGISEGNLRVRIHRIRKTIKKIFDYER